MIWAQINAYARVTAVSGTTLSLSDVNQTYHTFAAGEQIIVMQMQDTVIGADTLDNVSFGTMGSIANAGKYEVATISSVGGMPSSLTITGGLSNVYNTNANTRVQVISFNMLSTTNYTTASSITGVAWNGQVGGVVAFQVGGTLTLGSSVTADGLGFRGGAVNSTAYEVTCEPNVYDTTSTKYGFKGEGIYASPTISYTSHTGRGPLLNGGGGGSDDNGGGGGGGNYTSGGQGGQGWTCTTGTASGGLGGVALGAYTTGSRIFMGGGGGGGQQNNSVATGGKAGGGIVLIKADVLTTTCSGSVAISANGLAGATSGNDGGGGGGAGGTIVLQVNTFTIPSSCPLNLQSSGGNGGNVGDARAHGGGGGGGQGAIVYTAAIPTTNVTSSAANGTGGLNSNSAGASSAGSGGGTDNSGVITSTVLPIEFISFAAVRSGGDVLLDWSISVVSQSVSFRVWRSADGQNFHAIATLPGDVAENSYSFTDAGPGTGTWYYRIESVDVSGRSTFTPVIPVDLSGMTNAFALFPNPSSSGRCTIRMQQASDLSFLVEIEDLSGKILYMQSSRPAGHLIDVVTDKRLAAGIYIVRLTGNGYMQVAKLVVR